MNHGAQEVRRKKVRELVLGFASLVAAFGCCVSLFGIYWQWAGGQFAYEGGYFIVAGSLVGAIVLPVAGYFYVWPRPTVRRRLLVVCVWPYGAIVLLGLVCFWIF